MLLMMMLLLPHRLDSVSYTFALVHMLACSMLRALPSSVWICTCSHARWLDFVFILGRKKHPCVQGCVICCSWMM